jgi:cysteine desulfurase
MARSQGFRIDILPVRTTAWWTSTSRRRIDERTGLVAAMLVNNEIGVIQPVEEIGRLARAQGALFFCDAVQGFGRVPAAARRCDLVAVSAHKVHGPKGIGALWIREGVEIDPLLHGGRAGGGHAVGTLSPCFVRRLRRSARAAARADDEAHVESCGNSARRCLATLDRQRLERAAAIAAISTSARKA